MTLQGSGADVLMTAATPKFAAQAIRKIYDLNRKPLHFPTNVSGSVAAVINPAGPERAVGIIMGGYAKEVSDPAWENDPGMNEWQAFMKEYMPGADLADANYPSAIQSTCCSMEAYSASRVAMPPGVIPVIGDARRSTSRTLGRLNVS